MKKYLVFILFLLSFLFIAKNIYATDYDSLLVIAKMQYGIESYNFCDDYLAKNGSDVDERIAYWQKELSKTLSSRNSILYYNSPLMRGTTDSYIESCEKHIKTYEDGKKQFLIDCMISYKKPSDKDDLNSIDNKIIEIKEGDLVKSYGSPKVYLITNNTKKEIPNLATYLSWGYPNDYSTLKSISEYQLNLFKDGGILEYKCEYGYSLNNGVCTNNDDVCNNFFQNTKWYGKINYNGGLECDCVSGYNWNPSNTSCEKINNLTIVTYSNAYKTLQIKNDVKSNYKYPLFKFSGLDNISGYYVYFGQNKNADPIKQGKYIIKNEFQALNINKIGDYYLVVKSKSKDGKVSELYSFKYTYNTNLSKEELVILKNKEKISGPSQIKNYKNIEKIGSNLWGNKK